ncbi:hypothetical protein [Arthrobacter sp. 162MFSha1.1]|uniref:hypothetical protein n=1 Tax=Arthrobacter sp. 162MFSha1.1 TaxID=1151119 RepID=UPI00037D4653|nr:hypothetical protein [Arthrobacter sp. 162MFSha1.1]
MCRAKSEKGGRRCNGKCSNPAYVAAYQRARTEAVNAGTKAEDLPEYLEVSVAPEGDMEIAALADQIGEALKYESEERDEVLRKYGTEEQAVVALGALVAKRAEELAGITSQEVQAAWEERFDAAADEEERLALSDDATPEEEAAAGARFNTVYTGQDEQTLEDLGRLAGGYRAAVAEVRSVGGRMDFSRIAGEEPARELFEDAVQVYPSDWLAKSNDFGDAPAVFTTSGQQASYSPSERVEDKSRPLADDVYQFTPSESSRRSNKQISYEPLDGNPVGEGDPEEGKAWYREVYWEVHDGMRGRPSSDPAVKPDGEGWEMYEPGSVWRRPIGAMYETMQLPTLTVMDHTLTGVAGKPQGYATAVHELAHRFEHTMVDILRLENAFVTRRTTLANGEREPLETWNPVVPHVQVRKDRFVDTYIGREYDRTDDERRFSAEGMVLGNAEHFGTGYEVLSMGTEALFGGSYGGFIGAGKWSADEDHRNFVLGVMAAAGRPW